MKRIDLRKIHRALEHGDITVIAANAGVRPDVVTEVLLRGWHSDKRNDVVSAALDVIREKGENPELVKEAENMKFVTDTFTGKYPKLQHKFARGHKYYGKKFKPVYLLVGAGLILLLFGNKIKELLGNVKS